MRSKSSTESRRQEGRRSSDGPSASSPPNESPRTASDGTAIHGLVDHLFRRQSASIVASLVRSFGPAHLDLAEEVVQEALLQALRKWPHHGLPERPGAWLHRVARNLALDRLRRSSTFQGKLDSIRHHLERPGEAPSDVHLDGEITDDQLRLVFLCCHPALSLDSRVALTLKTVAGFGVDEIASAFLVRPSTVAQRLVRAKERIRQLQLPFEVPDPAALPERLDAALEVIYLLFNEGYATHRGEALIRAELCEEALRLAEELSGNPVTARPVVHALSALLCFQASRLPARLDEAGELVLLEDQDHSRWDRALLARAFRHLERSAQGNAQTAYHLQAAIAAQHAAAASEQTTDWEAILTLYDQLLSLNPSPVIALNRAVAVARARGPEQALDDLDGVERHPSVQGYYLFPATLGQLLQEAGRHQEAATAYRQALDCSCSGPERRFLERRLALCLGRRTDESGAVDGTVRLPGGQSSP